MKIWLRGCGKCRNMTLGRIPKKSQAKQNGLINAFPNDENNNCLQSININVIIFLTQVLDFSTSNSCWLVISFRRNLKAFSPRPIEIWLPPDINFNLDVNYYITRPEETFSITEREPVISCFPWNCSTNQIMRLFNAVFLGIYFCFLENRFANAGTFSSHRMP